jgi:hypothetical protein
MLGGNVRLTAAALKIHEQTIYSWKKMDWWNQLIQEIRKEEKLELSTRLKKIVNKSWDIVEDRLENGDYVYNSKTGEVSRKGVNLRDASKVAVDAALLRDKIGSDEAFTTATEQIGEKLAKLAEAFSKLSKGIVAPEDIEYKEKEDALHEEGPSDGEISQGFQDGILEIPFETLTEEETK